MPELHRNACFGQVRAQTAQNVSDVLYVENLAAPDTINTIPEKTLLVFADHGSVGAVLPVDGGDAEAVMAMFAKAGVDDRKLAAALQQEGADALVESWMDLLDSIESRSSLQSS